MSVFARSATALLVPAIALFLAACEEDTKEIKVLTVSGDEVKADGTWAGSCEASGSDGQQVVAVFDGDHIALTFLNWAGDTSCASTPTADVYELKVKVTGEKTVTWSGGTAPNSLPDSILVSTVRQTDVNDSTSVRFDLTVIDDTADPMVIYGGDEQAPVDADGYPDELRTTGLFKL